MANIKSAIKRIQVGKRNTLKNKIKRTEIKTAIKKFESTLSLGKADDAKELLKDVDKKLKKASAKNIIHKNAAARKVSRLTKKLNKLVK
ncbi:small subunit ribosomal protein S20 [Peptoniphilus koenoeneniae]|uniref:Small ribosomal subunit protein bS20 n=1 Tax=Peptoniphilus koenoeneniae TaxID=507751 RepID=A0ABU0ATK2_9FIRM|nr:MULTISPECIES: 30S ribosomal protein S20 [Peptoniphilus]ERT59456.1 ribosomal protein S20 [Peptoniphilus sp. BV3C26]MDQ0274603.1 small subunit ribosomal protein S20 [Peptoniphilus koenoeneniae]